LAVRDARPDNGRPSLGQTARACRAGQRPLGDRFDLVRLAARSNSGVPQLEIAPKLIEAYHHPELTPRLKAKIFGINGARVYGVDVPAERKKTEADPIGVRKQAYRERAEPVFETFGPKTDREFEALAAERKGLPT
jgi:hypothetical protein